MQIQTDFFSEEKTEEKNYCIFTVSFYLKNRKTSTTVLKHSKQNHLLLLYAIASASWPQIRSHTSIGSRGSRMTRRALRRSPCPCSSFARTHIRLKTAALSGAPKRWCVKSRHAHTVQMRTVSLKEPETSCLPLGKKAMPVEEFMQPCSTRRQALLATFHSRTILSNEADANV